VLVCACGLAAQTPVQGEQSNNGSAAGANRVATLPCIAQTTPAAGTAATAGRDAAPNCGTDNTLWVSIQPARRPAHYSASKKFAASSTTDNACIPGNATTDVVLTRIEVTGTQTTAGIVTLEVAKRSTAASGGTSANFTVVPDESAYGSANSTPVSYSGTGPTVGTLVGDLDNPQFAFLAAASTTPNDIYIADLLNRPVTLIGTTQSVCLNLGGAVTGGNISVKFRWDEVTHITP
jgi:hypothetical protein